MTFSSEFIKKHIIQREGTFLKGFPIKKKLIAFLAGAGVFGILVAVFIFLCLIIFKNTISYGVLFGFSTMFIVLTLPCTILLLKYNRKINSAKEQILSDEDVAYIDMVVYKIHHDINRKDIYNLQAEFEYKGRHVIVTTKTYTAEYGVIPLNMRIHALYSPKFNDILITI